eukprot:gene22448-30705_t
MKRSASQMLPMMQKEIIRCSWVNTKNQVYVDYHDNEWGRYSANCSETLLFEFLNLEGAQAGLSWEVILKKREAYALAFDGWDVKKIAAYDDNKVNELMGNAGIVRHRQKIKAVITNAQAYLELCKDEECRSLNHYIHSFLPDGKPIINDGKTRIITSSISDAISKDLKKRHFKFVGSTIIYAYLQALGFVNDHDEHCFFKSDVSCAVCPTTHTII